MGSSNRTNAGPGARYVRTDAVVRICGSVLIEPLAVATVEDWHPTRDVVSGVVIGIRKMTKTEMQRIEDSLGAVFRRIFADSLQAGGFAAVESPRGDTLRVSIGLANVYIDTPDGSIGKGDQMRLLADEMKGPHPAVGPPRLGDAGQFASGG